LEARHRDLPGFPFSLAHRQLVDLEDARRVASLKFEEADERRSDFDLRKERADLPAAKLAVFSAEKPFELRILPIGSIKKSPFQLVALAHLQLMEDPPDARRKDLGKSATVKLGRSDEACARLSHLFVKRCFDPAKGPLDR